LPQALVSRALLHRQGIPTEIRIGTRYKDGQFEAHAWIEANGAQVDISTDPRADPFVAFEGSVLS